MSRDANAPSTRTSWRHSMCAAGLCLLLACGALGLAELAVRGCFPAINFQDTDATLLYRHPQTGYQWRPNTAGFCFGERVQIDAAGCRDLQYSKAASEHWLILGDSVAFGVGVPAAETFVGRVERVLPKVHLLNASVVGMNLDGQLATAQAMLASDTAIRRITLFYCLNDLEDVSGESATSAPHEASAIDDLSPRTTSVGERVRGLLRSRSKLYLLLKGLLADRSQAYFWCDYARYGSSGGATSLGLDRLAAIAELASARGIPFEVVLLPYEYQLRAAREELWAPQREVAAYLAQRNIRCHDARHWLNVAGHESREWYLYGDPMHLSSAGHRQIASHWLRSMSEVTPLPTQIARPAEPPLTSKQ